MARLRLLFPGILFVTCAIAQDTARTGWVVIPINEYGALHSRAFPTEGEPEPAPVEATLTRVDYDLRIEGPLVTGRASLTVDVLKEGWVRVPIPPGLLVREAKVDGKLVPLVPTADKGGQPAVMLSRKGRSVLMLDVIFNVAPAGTEERIILPTHGSGVTRAIVAVPPVLGAQMSSKEVEVKVSGGFMAECNARQWTAYARGSEPLTFLWKRKVEEKGPELPLRMRGSLTQLVGLGEDSSSVAAEAAIDVVQGSAREVKVAVPESITINQVSGSTVSDWDVKGGELVVNFLEPVEHSARFSITGETRLARDGSIAIPMLRLLNAERESGGLAVEVIGAGEIKDAKLQGLEEVEAAELAAPVAGRQSPSLSAFRFRPGTSTRSLNVDVVRYAQQAVLTANVEEARYRVLMSAEGKTLVQARYAVRNNQRNFARITLPAGAVMWSASIDGRPIRPGKAPDSGLLFALSKSRNGEEAPPFAIEVIYLAHGQAWTDSHGRATLTLPALDLPVSRTSLVLYYPPQFRVTSEPGAFRSESYERPVSEALSSEAPAQPAATPVSAGPSAGLQGLVDRYNAVVVRKKAGVLLPITVSFPAIGPTLFLVSELTGESKAPAVELTYQKDRKGGVR